MRLAELLLEDRADFIAQLLGSKLVARLKQDTNEDAEPKAIVDQLAQADPTPTKLYIQWIAKQYIAGQFKMEDVTQIKDELIEFERVKSRLANKDINSYKNLPELYAALRPFAEQEVVSNNAQQAQLKDEMYKQAEVIYKGPDFTLVSPKTMEASQFFGKNTKWCTAALKDNEFNEYNEKGPLLALMDKTGNKFQFQFPNDPSDTPEIKDVQNQGVLLKDVLDKYPGLLDILLAKTNLSKWADPTNPDTVRWNIKNVIKGRWPEAEPYIMRNPIRAYFYAKDVIKGRWPEAEPYIMKDPTHAYSYARDIIKGRWPEAEPYIMKDVDLAYKYVKYVIKGRWPEAEPIIAKDVDLAFLYAHYIIKGRWPEAEPYMVTKPSVSWRYANYVIEGRWPEAERYIMQHPEYATYYAEHVIKGRWPEAEPIIMTDPSWFKDYKAMLKRLGIPYTKLKELK